MPKEDEAATWVVGREGGQPRRLTDDERRRAPLANGSWDRGAPPHRRHRSRRCRSRSTRCPGHDTRSRARRGTESNVRWARNGSHVTFVRDNNVFIVPAQAPLRGRHPVQLTDIAVRHPVHAAPPTVSASREKKSNKLLDWVEQEAERRKRREARDLARALPKFELSERQTIADAALSGDETSVLLVVADRAEAPRLAGAALCRRVGLHRGHPRRETRSATRKKGRRLAVLNLKSGEAVLGRRRRRQRSGGDSQTARGDARLTAAAPPAPPAPKRPMRWGTLLISPDGRQAAIFGAIGRQHRPLARARRSHNRQGARSRRDA